MLQALDRITFNPQIMAGQACVRGMRIPVSLVVNLVANGKPNEEILEEYPDLELEDIQQALQYAAWLTRDGQNNLQSGDRLMLREGIPTVRFTDKECRERTGEVVTEFLGVLSFTKWF
ncbi:MAG: DUF433 domain-containing protein [Snowella sp.]|nr:DUF433 domain-containing protein [Snowella sp.]